MTDKPTLAEFVKVVLGTPIPAWQVAALEALQGVDPKKLVIMPVRGRSR